MHGRPHIWANGVSWPPWKNGWKIKKRKHAKKSSFLNGGWGWSDTSDDWLVKLMIIVIIIDHYPYSRVSLFLYILRRSPNSVSYPRSLLSVAKFDDLSFCFLRPALLVRGCGHWRHLLTTNLQKDNSQFQGKSKSSRLSFHWISILLILTS